MILFLYFQVLFQFFIDKFFPYSYFTIFYPISICGVPKKNEKSSLESLWCGQKQVKSEIETYTASSGHGCFVGIVRSATIDTSTNALFVCLFLP